MVPKNDVITFAYENAACNSTTNFLNLHVMFSFLHTNVSLTMLR